MKPTLKAALLFGAATLLALVLIETASAQTQIPETPKPPQASAEFTETPARAEEPLAKEFSLERAARSLDAGAINFAQKRRCVQCHANLMYLTARPALDKVVPSPPDMRAFHEWIVETRWPQFGVIYDDYFDALAKDNPAYRGDGVQRFATEAIVVAFGLATHDRATTGKLHPTTRLALEKVFSRQRADGGFNVVSDGLGSFLVEFDQMMLATVAVGSAPEDFSATDPAKKFLAGIRRYLAEHPPQAAYQQGMLLWAASRVPDLATANQRESSLVELRRLQRPDGGWCLADLLADDEQAQTGKFADKRPSDGYGTGFAIFALRNAGVAANDPAPAKGIAWLKANQRESGRWFQPSFAGRPNNLISNSATAWAVLALASCGETQPQP